MIRPRLSARHLLRESTRDAHEGLHHLPEFAALAAGRIGRDGYVALLGRLLGFHRPMEDGLALVLGGESGELAPRAWRRADLLRQDLAHFGATETDLEELPAMSAPLPRSRATALGRLYVLEGSTLGGRLLARRLDAILPSGGLDGRRFLSGGTEPEHARWDAICGAIDQCGASDGELADMVEGAHDSFLRFKLWFDRGTAT